MLSLTFQCREDPNSWRKARKSTWEGLWANNHQVWFWKPCCYQFVSNFVFYCSWKLCCYQFVSIFVFYCSGGKSGCWSKTKRRGDPRSNRGWGGGSLVLLHWLRSVISPTILFTVSPINTFGFLCPVTLSLDSDISSPRFYRMIVQQRMEQAAMGREMARLKQEERIKHAKRQQRAMEYRREESRKKLAVRGGGGGGDALNWRGFFKTVLLFLYTQ